MFSFDSLPWSWWHFRISLTIRLNVKQELLTTTWTLVQLSVWGRSRSLDPQTPINSPLTLWSIAYRLLIVFLLLVVTFWFDINKNNIASRLSIFRCLLTVYDASLAHSSRLGTESWNYICNVWLVENTSVLPSFKTVSEKLFWSVALVSKSTTSNELCWCHNEANYKRTFCLQITGVLLVLTKWSNRLVGRQFTCVFLLYWKP